MSKPLSYYGIEYEYFLIQDIIDTWGEGLESLTEADRYWLIASIAEFYFMEISADYGEIETDAAYECYERIMYGRELSLIERESLLLALANKSRGQCLGYWNLPPASYDNQLIKDIIETWGESLEAMNEIDRAYLMSKIGRSIWIREMKEHHDNEPALGEICTRMDEVPYTHWEGFIKALVNR